MTRCHIDIWIRCLLLALLGVATGAMPPPVGSIIVNQARITFTDPESRQNLTIRSNEVRTIVGALEALELTEPQSRMAPPGTRVELPHVLRNIGNVRSSYTVLPSSQQPALLSTQGLHVYLDLNRNGSVDPEDPELDGAATPALNPGESLALVLVVQVSGEPGAPEQGAVALRAQTQLQGASAENSDSIEVAHSVAIRLVNTASVASAQPNQSVTFTLTGTNIGMTDAKPLPVTVDGQLVSLVVVRNPIPANTDFVAMGTTAVGIPAPPGRYLLYHVASDPPDRFTMAPPANLADVDAVAYGLPDLPASARLVFSMEVRLHGNASRSIADTGAVTYFDPSTATHADTMSNTVTVDVPRIQPTLHYYTDDTFVKTTEVATLGGHLYVQVAAASSNTDPTRRDQILVTITSTLTGDMETFGATETGPNTGLFRIEPYPFTRDGAINPVVHGNTILETRPNDTLTATITGYDGVIISARVLIDPYGIVFDSVTNTPVAGVTVTLIDVTGAGNGGNAGGPAQVWQVDGVHPAPSTLTTDTTGTFSFPRVAPSTYRLQVVPPTPYTFPSVVPIGMLPAGRLITDASYGKNFTIIEGSDAVKVDVPVDPHAALGMLATKTASRRAVEIGDIITYTVTLKNTAGVQLTAVALEDRLPTGFAFEPGSTRLGGVSMPDPAGGTGPQLRFAVGTLNPDQSAVLTYRVRVTVGTGSGDRANRAQAAGGSLFGPAASNVAEATVTVRPGVFTTQGIIIGKVFVDADHNRVQGMEEPGIPGVRIYLDDGTFAITDSEGKYSLYGVTPRTHVLRLDMTTMPPGSQPINLTNRDGGDAISYFVDMTAGMLFKADFAEGSHEPTVLADIRARRLRRGTGGSEIAMGAQTPLARDPNPPLADVRGLPASGLVFGGKEYLIPPTPPQGPPAPVAPRPTTTPVDVTALLESQPAELGFVDLHDGDVLPATQLPVRVRGVAGALLKLTVNGMVVPDGRIGLRTADPARQLQLLEYVGVSLHPGENVLELAQFDSFGNQRGVHKVTVLAPGDLRKIDVQVPARGVPADGRSEVLITIRLLDAHGVPVCTRTAVTLDASLGEWQTTDASPAEPGCQVFIEGGRATFRLLAPGEAGPCAIGVTSGICTGSATLRFLPFLQPFMALGSLEGAIGFGKRAIRPLSPDERWGLAEEMRQLAALGGNTFVYGRAGMYARGAVGHDYLLTVAFDSEKRADERLFRDIQPDEFYPVYGDSAIKGYDAQSTGQAYVRVDRGPSYLLYGDYTTCSPYSDVSLGGYNRSLTGIRHHMESARGSLDLFASDTAQRQGIEELPAQGISGPYYVQGAPVIENSEKVEIIVRDRNQPAVILQTLPKVRFLDYEFDYRTGRLLLRAPVPSADQNLNPVTIRVTYEVASGGARFWVTGGSARVLVSDRLSLGGTLVHDDTPGNLRDLSSANLCYALGHSSSLLGEIARTNHAGLGTGWGRRVELRHKAGSLDLDLYAGRTDPTFENPAATLGSGRQESGAKVSYQPAAGTRLIGEAIHTEDVLSGGRRNGYQVAIERALPGNARAELGLRHATETTIPAQASSLGATPVDFTSIRAKLTGQAPRRPNLTVYGEYEQDVRDASKRVATLGADYRVGTNGRIYARHELISSLSGRYSLNDAQSDNTTVIGIDADYRKDAHVFSEYRARDAFSGREAEAAIGLRNRWQIREGVRVDATFERLKALQGTTDTDSLAVTGALEYTIDPRWKGTARLEARQSSGGDTYLNTLGLAYKVNRDWTFLGRSLLSITGGTAGANGNGTEARLQLGAAFRPVDSDEWAGLIRYELRHGAYDPGQGLASPSTAHILATDINYQPTRALTYGAHYAGRWLANDVGTVTHMVTGRITYDLSERTDIGLLAGTIRTMGSGETRYVLGAEAGYLLHANLWLSAGYNMTGFTAADLAGEGYTDPGFYLRLRYKFDEGLFSGRL